jgi:hypothetical protein
MAKLTTHDVTQFWRVTTKKFVIRSKSVLISVEIMTVPRHLDIPAPQRRTGKRLYRVGLCGLLECGLDLLGNSIAYVHAMQSRHPGD